MKNKTMKKIWTSILALIGILALFVAVTSIWSLISDYLSENVLRNLIISTIALFILMLIGGISWKKILNKIKDIFT